jgi:predicted DNA binding protein
MTYLRAENPVPSERCPGQATNEYGRTDVRTVIEALQTRYDVVTVRAQWERSRNDVGSLSSRTDLINKQRAALETAYYAGFFD